MPIIKSPERKATEALKLKKEREKIKKKEIIEKANQQIENEKRLDKLEEEKKKITTNLAQLETEYDKKNKKSIFTFGNSSNIQTISKKIKINKDKLNQIENNITKHKKTLKKKSQSQSQSQSNSKSNSHSNSKTKSKSKTSSGSNKISGILRKKKKRKARGTTKRVQFKSDDVQYFDKNESVQSLMKGKRSKTLKSKTNSK